MAINILAVPAAVKIVLGVVAIGGGAGAVIYRGRKHAVELKRLHGVYEGDESVLRAYAARRMGARSKRAQDLVILRFYDRMREAHEEAASAADNEASTGAP